MILAHSRNYAVSNLYLNVFVCLSHVGMAAAKNGSVSFVQEDILDVMSMKNVSKKVIALLEDVIEKEVKFNLPQSMLMEVGG